MRFVIVQFAKRLRWLIDAVLIVTKGLAVCGRHKDHFWENAKSFSLNMWYLSLKSCYYSNVDAGDLAVTDFLSGYFNRESSVASHIDFRQIACLIGEIDAIVKTRGVVYLAGNGGSAATAEHFAVDLGVGAHIRKKKKVVNAISLSSNSAILTALGNDVSFEDIFSMQLEIHNPGSADLVIVISASGDSPNILRLLETAKKYGVKTCAITGFEGGKAKNIADVSIHVPTNFGEYGIVEDLHLAICHAVAEALRK
jgi:D-sedoheptulose 7-phosphate isomerase